MYKILLVFLIKLCYNTSILAADCNKHPIYCKILILQPKMDKALAMKISNIISKYSKIYGIDPIRSIAIANQESGIRMINRCIPVIIEKNIGLKLEIGCTDIGIFQINVNTIKEYNLDITKLNHCIDYNIKSYHIIMKDKINHCKNLADSWSCYHSKTEKHRQKYIKAVNKYYNLIKD